MGRPGKQAPLASPRDRHYKTRDHAAHRRMDQGEIRRPTAPGSTHAGASRTWHRGQEPLERHRRIPFHAPPRHALTARNATAKACLPKQIRSPNAVIRLERVKDVPSTHSRPSDPSTIARVTARRRARARRSTEYCRWR